MKLLLILGKGPDSDMKDVKVRHNDFAKRNVDECSQEDAEVRHDEVHDEDLLGQGFLVCSLRLVILELSEPRSGFGKNDIEDGVDGSQDSSRNEYLE